jgi:putative transport protein
VSLGIAGVLFVGLAFAHFGIGINHHVMEFLRDVGLILFVFTIGLQVGPGFFSSLRRNGLPLNVAAATVVLTGAALTVVQYKLFMQPDQLPAAVGLMSGATTNTPSMAAAQATFTEIAGRSTTRPTTTATTRAGEPARQGTASADEVSTIGSAYAIAYPFGICACCWRSCRSA